MILASSIMSSMSMSLNQEILFVANKVHNVVVITTAGGHRFYQETQSGLGQVQHRFALNKKVW